MDVYKADGRTVWCWRNGTKTQRRQCDTDAEASGLAARMNAEINPPKKKTKSKSSA